MAFKHKNRVQEVSTTGFGGLGDVQLNGVPASPAGRVTFVASVGSTHTCSFLIDDGAGNWEITEGTVTSGSPDTLSRTTVLDSSTGGSKVDFASGQKDIVLIVAAENLPFATNAAAESLIWRDRNGINRDLVSGMEFISATVLSDDGFAIFTGLDDIDAGAYVFLFDTIVPATDNTIFRAEVGTGLGPDYQTASYEFHRSDLTSGSALYAGVVTTTDASLSLATNVGNSTGEVLHGQLTLFEPSGGLRKSVLSETIIKDQLSNMTAHKLMGFWDGGNAAITAIRFFMSSGNLASGIISIFRVRKS